MVQAPGGRDRTSGGDAGALPEAGDLARSLGGEYPDQTLLELAIRYDDMGLGDDALRLLTSTPRSTPEPLIHRAWRARLANDPSLLEDPGSPAFEFPYRGESFHVLGWATRRSDHWVWKYLLALSSLATDREAAAGRLFREIGQAPDFAPYYVVRAEILNRLENLDPTEDLQKAVELAPNDKVFHVHLIRHFQNERMWERSLAALERARGYQPADFNLDLLQARALVNLGRGAQAAELLGATQVLPSENARESHRLWEQAHTLAALDAAEAGRFQLAREHLERAVEWPESLGQGRPYDPEERLVRFILGRVEANLGNREQAKEAFEAYLAATGEVGSPVQPLDLFAVEALRALERRSEAEAVLDTLGSQLEAARSALGEDLEARMIRRALNLGGNRP
jgi:tetratricopeptide (TPR) repeat protein